jgi:alpha-tubulin suppressor-like RCC1 family protein
MWGRGEHGRLGLGTDNKDKLQPVRVEPLAGEHVVHVSCGGSHSAALTKNGQLYVVSACTPLILESRALVLELTSVSEV